MKWHITLWTFAAFVLLRIPAAAQDETAQQSVIPECACYAQGQRWAQKQVVCIRGQRMVCGMSSNVASWLSLNESCQVSSLD
jgi:hypothetical protein